MHLNDLLTYPGNMHKETCGAIIDNGEGKILLQLREDKPSVDFPGTWSTFGGALEDDETPLEALQRELMEEIEYEVTDAEYLGKLDYIHVFRIVDSSLDVDSLVVHEGEKAAWVGPDELPHIPIYGRFREYFAEYFRRFC